MKFSRFFVPLEECDVEVLFFKRTSLVYTVNYLIDISENGEVSKSKLEPVSFKLFNLRVLRIIGS